MINNTFVDFEASRKLFVKRVVISGIFLLILLTLIMARYYDLQVTRHQDFVTQSDNNRVHVRPVSPTRGLIYDRNGKLLADNRSTYNLTIVRERSKDLDKLLADLGSLIHISENDISEFKKRLNRRKPFANTALKFDLTEQDRSILAVNSFRLEGAEVSAHLTRHYPTEAMFAHAVGYVGRINEQEMSIIDPVKYSGTDSIGRIGIEKEYENYLLGQVGSEHVETNARGRVMRLMSKKDPQPGQNLTLHLDSNLQQVAYNALENYRSALVAIDVKSGGILAMLSTPSYNPNAFVSGIGKKDYASLINSADRPLFNRALKGQYPPGSTIKPMLGLIALNEEIVTAEHTISDSGYFYLDGVSRPWRDHNAKKGGHGADVNLARAIVESCDVYFYTMSTEMDIDLLSSNSKLFGFGGKTNIDIPGEQIGIMPDRYWKKNELGEAWFDGDTVNASIGQGFMLATPLQLAVMTARLASNGRIVTPRLVKAINGVGIEPNNENSNLTDIDTLHWDYIHKAMQDVIHSPQGTANKISAGLNYRMAGKTGTAQVVSIDADVEYDKTKIQERQWDHALFIAFAPADDPEIAVALIVENGGHGSVIAAPIVRLVIDEFMKTSTNENLVLR